MTFCFSSNFCKTALFLVLVGGSFFAHGSSAKAQDVPDALQPVMPSPAPESEPAIEGFPTAEQEPPMPRILKNAVIKGAQSRYLGEFNGLHGWVLIKGGKPEFHYVTRDGGAIVMGMLFDEAGNLITGEQLRMLRLNEGASTYKLSDMAAQRFNDSGADDVSSSRRSQAELPSVRARAAAEAAQEAKPKTRAEKFYADVENGNWISMGDRSAPVVYAFIDVDCEHCRKFMRDVKPFMDRGVVQLRVLPVGFDEDGLRRAAYLLASPAPEDQMYKYIEGDESALFVPGDIQTQGASLNVAIMAKWETQATPVVTYKSRDGFIRFVRGAPDNVAIIVDELE
jgi:thiol:disulfide interchange protein DsbG